MIFICICTDKYEYFLQECQKKEKKKRSFFLFDPYGLFVFVVFFSLFMLFYYCHQTVLEFI